MKIEELVAQKELLTIQYEQITNAIRYVPENSAFSFIFGVETINDPHPSEVKVLIKDSEWLSTMAMGYAASLKVKLEDVRAKLQLAEDAIA